MQSLIKFYIVSILSYCHVHIFCNNIMKLDGTALYALDLCYNVFCKIIDVQLLMLYENTALCGCYLSKVTFM